MQYYSLLAHLLLMGMYPFIPLPIGCPMYLGYIIHLNTSILLILFCSNTHPQRKRRNGVGVSHPLIGLYLTSTFVYVCSCFHVPRTVVILHLNFYLDSILFNYFVKFCFLLSWVHIIFNMLAGMQTLYRKLKC